MVIAYLQLALAILFEIVATTSLKAIDGLGRPLPLLLAIGGYASAFTLLSLTMRTIPIGVAYAIWSGVGIVAIAVIGQIYYEETLDLPALCGIGLIIAGVLIINLLSGSKAL